LQDNSDVNQSTVRMLDNTQQISDKQQPTKVPSGETNTNKPNKEG